MRRRAGHQDRPAVGPLNVQIPTGQADPNGRCHKAPAQRRDGRRTGPGAARLRQARASFPDAQLQVIGASKAGDIGVDPVREERIGFDHRAKPGKVNGIGIVNEKDNMRIADIDRRWAL